MDEVLVAALAGLDRAFASYPRRAVLEGCPHCRQATPVDEHNLFSLTISLGNTVGNREDVKGLLPLLLNRLVTSDDLDPGIVLSKLANQEWRTWPPAEQRAIDRCLDAIWRSLLTQFPSRVGSFANAAEFLDAAALSGDSVDRFFTTWDTILGPPSDRHLALLVNKHSFADRRREATTAWLCRQATRDRLLAAFERDHDAVWADDFAIAHDILCLQPLAEQPG